MQTMLTVLLKSGAGVLHPHSCNSPDISLSTYSTVGTQVQLLNLKELIQKKKPGQLLLGCLAESLWKGIGAGAEVVVVPQERREGDLGFWWQVLA